MAAVAMDAEFGLYEHNKALEDFDRSWSEFEEWAERLPDSERLEYLMQFLERVKDASGTVLALDETTLFPGQKWAKVQFDLFRQFQRWLYAHCYEGWKP